MPHQSPSWEASNLGLGVGPLTPVERAAFTAVGGAFVLVGLRPRFLFDLALTGLGGYLLYRGLGGEGLLLSCRRGADDANSRGAQEFAALLPAGQRAETPRPNPARRADDVDEAAMQSFPASDPPSSTSAAATPSEPRPAATPD